MTARQEQRRETVENKNPFDSASKQLYKNTVHFESALSSPENTMASYAMKITLERIALFQFTPCLLYTSPSPRDGLLSRMPSSA